MATAPTADASGEVLIITGMSGAGKSGVANVLEDLGWFVVDNLPPQMLPSLLDTLTDEDRAAERIALVADVRGGTFFREIQGAIEELDRRPDRERPRVLFLTAADEVLVRRFESSRRPHPLQARGRILDGIQAERQLLADLQAQADAVIDTSSLTVHQLAHRVRELFAPSGPSLHVVVLSFGFKYGIPVDADLVADMRFLPNPYWVPELRHQTGRDAAVATYVRSQQGAEEFLDDYERVLATVLPGYVREGKRYATVAIGCTGGKHRSVAMTEELTARLVARGFSAAAVHRDLGRE
jgi:UPF0042 nucleotide-binding protein